MGTIYQVVVYGLRGEKMEVELCNTEEQFEKMTVLQLKEKIAERLPETAGLEALRLIFADKMLDGNDQLLSHFGIHQHSIIRISAFPQETNRPVYAPLGTTKFIAVCSPPPVQGIQIHKYPWGNKEKTRRLRISQDAKRYVPVPDKDSATYTYTPPPPPTDSTEMGTIYKVVVDGMRGERMEVDLCNTKEQFEKMTVLQLKEKIAESLHLNPGVCVCRCMCVCRCFVQTRRLIFADRLLNVDHQLLSHVGIQHMSVIRVVHRVVGGGSRPCHCGGMGDRGGKNRSMESLALFSKSTLD